MNDVSSEMLDIFMTFAAAYDAGLTLADFCDAASRPFCLSISDLVEDISERTNRAYWEARQ